MSGLRVAYVIAVAVPAFLGASALTDPRISTAERKWAPRVVLASPVWPLMLSKRWTGLG